MMKLLIATLLLYNCVQPMLVAQVMRSGGPGVLPNGKIDPRLHPPRDLGEIDYLASQIVRANQLPLRGRIVEEPQQRGIARIEHSGGTSAIIHVDARAAREIPINSWAFILGHELAHQSLGKGGDPESELDADLLGSAYAMKAGFDPAAYLAWVMTRHNAGGSTSHFPNQKRVEAIGRSLKIPAAAVHRWLR